MAEQPVPTQTETPPSPENSPSREKVMNTVNNAVRRWEGKIDDLHGQINSRVEIDDLADSPNLQPNQRDQLAVFRSFQKGVVGLQGASAMFPSNRLSDYRGDDYLNVTFQNPESGERYERPEGLDISGLIDSVKEDIALEKELQTTYRSPLLRQTSDRYIAEYEEELRILEASSIPMKQAYPDILDESKPMEKARLAEEARRIGKNPLTKGKSDQENWEAARQRLQKARLLKIPAKSSAEPVATPKTTPIITTEEPPIVPTKPLEGLYIPPKVTLEPEARKTLDNNIVKPTDLPRFDSYGEITDNKPISEGKVTKATETGYGSKIKDLIKGIKESGTTKITDITEKIGSLKNDELAKLDSNIRERVDILKKLKTPNLRKRDILILLVPIVMALCSPKDTRGNFTAPEMPQTTISEPGPEAPYAPAMGYIKHDIPPAGQGFSSYPEMPSPAIAPQSEPEQPAENRPVRGKTDEDPIIETEIKAGQTVRGIIVDALKSADPNSSPTNTDQAASLVLWKILADNPGLVNNPDLVQPGDKVIIPGTLDKFMEGFNGMDQQRKGEIINELNHVPNNPEAKKSATSKANELYTILRYSSGGINP